MTMTSIEKIESNRENALASTGPKSAEGKAIVSRNAIRHGLLSWKPVIPGFETVEDWDSHHERTLESLAPVGYAETMLAERAALLLWRLDRVSRYEREVTAIALEHAEARKQPKLEEAERTVETAHARVSFAEGLRSLPAGTPLESEFAARFLEQAAGNADLDLYEMRGWPSFVSDESTLEDLEWTAGRLLECVQVVAKQAKIDADELLDGISETARDSLAHAQKERAKLQTSFDRERRGLLLPDSLTMEKVNRYETTLERSLLKTLHELERRQAARDGQTVPLPVAVDVNVSGAGQE